MNHEANALTMELKATDSFKHSPLMEMATYLGQLREKHDDQAGEVDSKEPRVVVRVMSRREESTRT